MKNVIEVKNLKKKYKNVEAVRDISFSVYEGEIFGFLGPNGAGKTSTIRIICGLSRPTSGKCLVLGKERGEMTPRMGIVFEESNLYERLSGETNLNFFAGLYNIGKERVRELLHDFELNKARNRLVKNYSRGMKQRLLICRALLNDPELLILDEPTSGLDPTSAHFIREAVRDFKRRGKTVFLTTHYMEEADELCDRVAFIDQGRIVALENPDLLKQKYGIPGVRISVRCSGDKECKFILNQFEQQIIQTSGLFVDIEVKSDQMLSYLLDKIRDKAEIVKIHSQEATLAAVFMKLTGNSLK